MIRSKKIKRIVIVLLTLFFIIMVNSNQSFAKILSLDLESLKIYLPDNQEEDDGNVNGDEENSENDDGKNIIEEGVYTIACAKNTNYVLDIAWNSLDWGGNLQICNRNGGSNQKFYISYEGDGNYKIANVGSALILDVQDGNQENGTNIRQWEDNGAIAQRWEIRKNSDNTYSFIAKCSGKALDVDGGVFEIGTNVQQWDYINSDAQHFVLEKTEFLPEGIVSIRKVSNHDVSLDINNTTSKDGTQLQIWEENGGLSQRFWVYRVGENRVRIRTVASGGWLTEKGSKSGSAVVQLGSSLTSANNANTWEVSWNNGIMLKNRESGLYLNINNNSNTNGAKVEVAEKDNSTSAQRFLVNKENFIKDGWYEIGSALGTTLDLDHAGSDWGVNILTWEKNDQNNQKFRIKYTDSGYLIYSMYGLPIEVKDGNKANGANVQQWEENGALCQKWWPDLLDGGYIGFKNAETGKYLDVADASSAPGANVQQWEENGTEAQMWKLTQTTFVSGWFNENGSMYCVDPITGQLVKNCTRVDPMMQDPAQFGSLYDFDSSGRATWHLPTVNDLPGGTGPSAPIPELVGDQRQRTLQLALSRIGCPYELLQAPTGFVCDGLTGWCVTNATGIKFKDTNRLDDQDMSWQHKYIREHNGVKTDISQLKAGDIIFWGDPGRIENHETYGARHVSIYYHDGIMIHAADPTHGVCEGSLQSEINSFGDLIDFGSPYDADTSKCEIAH